MTHLNVMNTQERQGACASLLCDNCRKPGRCCTGFRLGGGSFAHGTHALEVLVKLATVWTGLTDSGEAVAIRSDPARFSVVQIGLPFMPLDRDAGGVWRFWCPVLGRDGRCTEYASRPALCRDFEAGSDRLCAMFVPQCSDEPAPALEKLALEPAAAA